MKVPFKKPVGSRVSDMTIMPGTVRKRPLGQVDALGRCDQGWLTTATYVYPEGHQMRKYRDAKKAARRARNG